MGNIPYESQIDARTGRSGGARLRNGYNADAFGAGIGRAVQQVGAAVTGTGDMLVAKRDKEENEEAIHGTAVYDPTEVLNQVKQEAGTDTEGLRDKMQLALENHMEEYVGGFENDRVRQGIRTRLSAQLAGRLSSVDGYVDTVRTDMSKQRVNDTLYTLQNKVLSDPTQYEEAVKLGTEAIDTHGSYLDPNKRSNMQTQYAYDTTKTLFEGKLNRATDAAQLDAVAAELTDESWQKRLLPRDYEDLTNKIESTKKAYTTKVTSEAKAALTTLESRSKNPTDLIPTEELVAAQKTVAASGSVEAQQRMARVNRDQSIVRYGRKLTPEQMRVQKERNSNKENMNASSVLPPELAVSVNKASEYVGDISAGYLTATSMREFGGELSKATPDYGLANPGKGVTSTGVMQFTEGTFKSLVKDANIAAILGVKDGMTEQQILDLRKDPDVSVMAGAILAKQNKAILEKQLGRGISDPELYMAHFLGAPKAAQFLKMKESQGETAAASLFPKEAEANRNVFYDKSGKARSLDEVYDGVSRSFTAVTSQVSYEDNKVWDKMITEAESSLSGNKAMQFAESVGVVALTPITEEGGFAARGAALETASTFYRRSMQPFTPDEEGYIQKTLEDGSADQALSLMANIQTMGEKGARAAFDQIKVKNPAFAHAGLLALTGGTAIASDVVRGSTRMKENPSLMKGAGAQEDVVSQDFRSVVDASLSQLAPGDAEGVQQAAMAYLAENRISRGGDYSRKEFTNAINAVTGGRIASVNGTKVFLPQGVAPKTLEFALEHMTVADYTAMSVSGKPPIHSNGQPVDPVELADEADLFALGGDRYKIADGTGGFLLTGNKTDDGREEVYIIDLSYDRVSTITNRHRGDLDAYLRDITDERIRNSRFGIQPRKSN